MTPRRGSCRPPASRGRFLTCLRRRARCPPAGVSAGPAAALLLDTGPSPATGRSRLHHQPTKSLRQGVIKGHGSLHPGDSTRWHSRPSVPPLVMAKMRAPQRCGHLASAHAPRSRRAPLLRRSLYVRQRVAGVHTAEVLDILKVIAVPLRAAALPRRCVKWQDRLLEAPVVCDGNGGFANVSAQRKSKP